MVIVEERDLDQLIRKPLLKSVTISCTLCSTQIHLVRHFGSLKERF